MPPVHSTLSGRDPPQHHVISGWYKCIADMNVKLIEPPVLLQDFAKALEIGKNNKPEDTQRSEGDDEAKHTGDLRNYLKITVPTTDGDTSRHALTYQLYIKVIHGGSEPVDFFKFIQDEQRWAKKLGITNN